MIEIRPATTDEDLAEVVRIVTTVSPDTPTSVEDMRWSDEKYPGGRRFVAWLDGVAVGAGGAGRIYMFPPGFDGLWGSISVLPEHRRRGVGSALLAALSDVAREAGKTMLMGRTTSDQQAAIDFLEHRGFREHERMKVVRLDLAGVPPPVVDAPEGLLISSLEEHPELVPSVYRSQRRRCRTSPVRGPWRPRRWMSSAPATSTGRRSRRVAS